MADTKNKKTKKDKFAHLDPEEGTLENGLPFRAFGKGTEPLVVLRWFTTSHTNPEGWERTVELKQLSGIAEHFRVYAVNRAPGMAPGTSMADIAAAHAEAIRARFGGPVHVLGPSSGGSLAMQLAADHPQVVKKLVVAMAGHTMGDEARVAQRRYTDAAEAGRRGMHHTALVSFKHRAVGCLVYPLMWLMDPFMRPKDASDMIAFARAEETFDVTDRLPDIAVPTLVIAGGADRACPPGIGRRTARELPDAELRVYEGASHMGTFNSPRFTEDILEFLGVRPSVKAE